MSTTTRVVLVGAGHAHVQVLRSWADSPPAGVELTLVEDRSEATYSGMVPGFVAGEYSLAEAQIAVAPLARRCGATLVGRRAAGIDPVRRIVEVEGASPLPYDLASLDLGATVRGLDLPGVREHALATRPIGDFVAALDDRVSEIVRAGRSGEIRVAVVGAGAAGVELAFTLRARLAAAGAPPNVFLVCGSAGFLPGFGPAVRRLAAREAEAAGIQVAATSDAVFVDGDGVGFATGHLAADLVVWATGAAPGEMAAASALPRDAKGFVRVGPTLEVRGCPGLFAAGDCAGIEGAAWVPKSGVYAVRAGPVLDANLRASLRGEALEAFVPQRNALALLNLGGGRALATKWGLAFSGRLARRWKDRVDRAFVEGFRDHGAR
ncbi:MAG: FAD-dependent oxidoreductase [Candidatus Binatia bacterium]